MSNLLFIWQQENGVSNHDLAAKIPCHESFICHYHHGRKNFSPAKCQRISELTGIPVMKLLFPKEKDE
jgi:predicted transcriptional regulator